MNIIGDALKSLEQQYPDKPPKKIIRNIKRVLTKPLKQRSRCDRKFLLSFSIAIFEVLLPDDILDVISKSIEPKIRKRLLSVRMLLLSLMVYHLSPEIKSYNDLIRDLTIRLKHQLPSGVETILSKSSFTYQLSLRSPRIFRAVLIYLLNLVVERTSAQMVKGKYGVKAMDYSVFNVAPMLEVPFQRACNQGGETRVQCRMHTVFDTIKKVVEHLSISPARTSEKREFNTLFAPFLNQKDTIWVCDLGYWAFWIMDTIMDHGQHFVFRLREKTAYSIVQVLDPEREDYLVRLGYIQDRKGRFVKHLVRLVACPQEGSEIYYYVTSLLDPAEFNAQDIRAVYKLRWSIEIFFRHFKQVIDFQPRAQNPNGIEIEFLGALITYTFVQMIAMDVAERYGMSIDDLSFSETYQTVNSWIRKKHRVFSEATTQRVRAEYEALLAWIAQHCISETTKKRLAQERRQHREEEPYQLAA